MHKCFNIYSLPKNKQSVKNSYNVWIICIYMFLHSENKSRNEHDNHLSNLWRKKELVATEFNTLKLYTQVSSKPNFPLNIHTLKMIFVVAHFPHQSCPEGSFIHNKTWKKKKNTQPDRVTVTVTIDSVSDRCQWEKLASFFPPRKWNKVGQRLDLIFCLCKRRKRPSHLHHKK